VSGAGPFSPFGFTLPPAEPIRGRRVPLRSGEGAHSTARRGRRRATRSSGSAARTNTTA